MAGMKEARTVSLINYIKHWSYYEAKTILFHSTGGLCLDFT
ncbi:unnamed protein product, partial [marine sediment metagenome]